MRKLIAVLMCVIGFHVQAGVISIALDDNELNVGDNTEVTVSGMTFDSFDSLDMRVEFDTSLFAFAPLSVGGDLFDTLPSIFTITEQVYGVAISFVDSFAFGASNFTVASFTLTALAVGDTGFELTNIVATDFIFPVDAVAADTDVTASITAVSVSTPTTLGVFSLASLIFMGLRRKL